MWWWQLQVLPCNRFRNVSARSWSMLRGSPARFNARANAVSRLDAASAPSAGRFKPSKVAQQSSVGSNSTRRSRIRTRRRLTAACGSAWITSLANRARNCPVVRPGCQRQDRGHDVAGQIQVQGHHPVDDHPGLGQIDITSGHRGVQGGKATHDGVGQVDQCVGCLRGQRQRGGDLKPGELRIRGGLSDRDHLGQIGRVAWDT